MTVRTKKNAASIIEGLTNGTPLRQLCRELGISKSAVYDWIDADEDLAGRIAQARARGFDQIAEEALEIADAVEHDTIHTEAGEKPNTEWITRSRLRVETRLKLLAKWDPKRYGDATMIKHADADGEKIQLDEVGRAARLAALASQINAANGQHDDAGD